ncbi:B3 domain-containing protein Os01g0723500-like isoform X2 [Herrania umbratica]|uniref:B3 domain-containing protein Os01g0723500-like isoform X2 n=1 Tax=Herrania umbratica TaxID=108875 RepID=A0A6J1AK80_9ROSI|nr:B3 domain-containing protein Os01g0723500-like isoform X2 [Herrania umbratica]
MAHRTRKRPRSNHAVDESLHFFKIILPHTIAEKKLKIPNKFVGKFGHELSSVATFVLPSGRKWEIRLTKADDRIWLDDGWHEFVEYNSIRCGYFLVFRYGKDSTFHVIIFDNSACEVDYPSYVPSNDEELTDGESEKRSIHQDSETEEDDSPELLGVKARNLNERANREAISGKQDASSQQHLVRKPQGDAASHKNSEVKQDKETRVKRCKTEEAEFDNLNESRQINSKIKQLRKSHRLPPSKCPLMNQNATGIHDQDLSVQLQDLKQQFDGKKLKITIQRANLQSLEAMHKGKQEHGSIQDEEIEIYVSRMFFGTSSTSRDRERAIRAVEVIKPMNPCFMIVLRRSNFDSSTMHVPAGFDIEYLSGVADHIRVQDSDGREWLIEFKRHRNFGFLLRKGCYRFWRENNLKEGDVCIFELRDKKAAVHKISIFRADSN